MKILSVFDGMSCGMLAFMSASVTVDEYHAYEIDKYAVMTSKHNFPSIIHHGDVFQGDFSSYRGFDFLVGGSPCTYWSIAQKNNRETTAEGMGWNLFQQYVRALDEAMPKYFIYENNKSMSKEIRQCITDTFGFEPICINSALVSAQNRNRLYWVGRRKTEDGRRKTEDGRRKTEYERVYVEQPKDRGILVRDILDGGCELSGNEKTYVLTASYDGAVPFNTIERSQRSMVAEPMQVGAMPRPSGELSTSQAFRVYSQDGKSVTINAGGGGAGGKTGLYAISEDGMRKNVYEVKEGMITIRDKQYTIKLDDGLYLIRKLTVDECKRLQTVPEWYDFSCVSNAQAYKMLGNGWTVEVIRHLIESCLK